MAYVVISEGATKINGNAGLGPNDTGDSSQRSLRRTLLRTGMSALRKAGFVFGLSAG
jgi:hypothetical protein